MTNSGFNFMNQDLMAYIMYPLTYTMGFETQDCFKMAGLLAHKILTTTMVIKTKSMNLL